MNQPSGLLFDCGAPDGFAFVKREQFFAILQHDFVEKV